MKKTLIVTALVVSLFSGCKTTEKEIPVSSSDSLNGGRAMPAQTYWWEVL